MADSDDEDTWRERLANAANVRVRTGSDPRWRRFGNVSEMGVLSGVGWAAFLAEIGVKPRRIPGGAFALDTDHLGTTLAVVACPCGHDTEVVALEPPSRCAEGDECSCPRSFFFDGDHVYCFNSPSAEEASIVPS